MLFDHFVLGTQIQFGIPAGPPITRHWQTRLHLELVNGPWKSIGVSENFRQISWVLIAVLFLFWAIHNILPSPFFARLFQPHSYKSWSCRDFNTHTLASCRYNLQSYKVLHFSTIIHQPNNMRKFMQRSWKQCSYISNLIKSQSIISIKVYYRMV